MKSDGRVVMLTGVIGEGRESDSGGRIGREEIRCGGGRLKD